jgi:hypothetical protein
MKNSRGGWKLLTTECRPVRNPAGRRFLVTNNLAGRNEYGEMTNLWLVKRVTCNGLKDYSAYSGDEFISRLTHYYDLDV